MAAMGGSNWAPGVGPPPPAGRLRARACPRPAFRFPRSQIANFAAVVDLVPNADPDDESIRLVPHAIYDALGFANLQQLSTFCSRDGYSGACVTRARARASRRASRARPSSSSPRLLAAHSPAPRARRALLPPPARARQAACA